MQWLLKRGQLPAGFCHYHFHDKIGGGKVFSAKPGILA